MAFLPVLGGMLAAQGVSSLMGKLFGGGGGGPKTAYFDKTPFQNYHPDPLGQQRGAWSDFRNAPAPEGMYGQSRAQQQDLRGDILGRINALPSAAEQQWAMANEDLIRQQRAMANAAPRSGQLAAQRMAQQMAAQGAVGLGAQAAAQRRAEAQAQLEAMMNARQQDLALMGLDTGDLEARQRYLLGREALLQGYAGQDMAREQFQQQQLTDAQRLSVQAQLGSQQAQSAYDAARMAASQNAAQGLLGLGGGLLQAYMMGGGGNNNAGAAPMGAASPFKWSKP